MPTQLTAKHWEEFWITCYFGPPEGKVSIASAVERAYLDFCRTLRGLPKGDKRWKEIRTPGHPILLMLLNSLHDNAEAMDSQEGFDRWHRSSCLALVEAMPGILTMGQAQKWVNMSLKYIVALGEERIEGYAPIASWCHAPLDQRVLDALHKLGCPRAHGVWSRIDDYGTYMRYQQFIRDRWPGNSALEVEYDLWQYPPTGK